MKTIYNLYENSLTLIYFWYSLSISTYGPFGAQDKETG